MSSSKDIIDQYTHQDEKRPNNPPVGLVTPATDPDQPRKKYSFDPRLDPQLQWSGKKENTEFEVDTVSLHVHERIDPSTILEKVLKKKEFSQQIIANFFESSENNLPLRDAIEFYKHDQNWSNRLIAGDSLLVMNSLLEKEGMGEKVQMIFMDPPYGIKYGSNFQPFVNKKDVKDRNDNDLTKEPEMIKAFRDTWELGIHSYLTQLQTRLCLSKKLLTESGSCFVQISEKNIHLVRLLMDEIFGPENFVSLISFRTKGLLGAKNLASIVDYLIWYTKDIKKLKFRKLFTTREIGIGTQFTYLELPDGSRRSMTSDEKNNPNNVPKNSRVFRVDNLVSAGGVGSTTVFDFEIDGKVFSPSGGRGWRTNQAGIKELIKNKRISASGKSAGYIFYQDDFPVQEITNVWTDSQGVLGKRYVVQTSDKVIQRCMLMTTDPGDLVFDPTCGSGTTANVAEKFGRRWITCDTSRIATTIAKHRLMTSVFDYYKLSHPNEGLKSGLEYKKVPHLTLGTIAHNEPSEYEFLFDQPVIDNTIQRISGPFTVESVPSPTVKALDVLSVSDPQSDAPLIQNKGTSRQEQWRHELLKTGIRCRGGQKIEFSHVESHPATRWIHADAQTKEDEPKRVMISFGPEHAPLEQRQIALAIEEAQSLVPKPKMIIFAAMQFDPEAAKDIDELNWPGVIVLKVEMNKDLLTSDLKKKRSNNESFWLIGQPDIELKNTKDGKYIISVKGFDYYDTKTGEIESGDSSKIAMWMLDTDYDGRSVYSQQVFFPMEDNLGGWTKLAKTLQAGIDEELILKYQGTESIPFEAGFNKRVAVKIIDARGIESLKIIMIK